MFYLKRYLIDWTVFLTSITKLHLLREIDMYSTRSRISVFCHSISARNVRLKTTLINKHTLNWKCAKCEIFLRTKKIIQLYMIQIFRKKRKKTMHDVFCFLEKRLEHIKSWVIWKHEQIFHNDQENMLLPINIQISLGQCFRQIIHTSLHNHETYVYKVYV